MDAKRGGVIVRLEGVAFFVPSSIALSVAPAPPLTRVPGAPDGLLGAAIHEGDVVPVIAVGDARGSMLLCSYLGEKIALTGAEIEATGLYPPDPASPDAVRYRGESARALDLAAIYARVQGAGWAGRWRA
jgi:hypothetical protein